MRRRGFTLVEMIVVLVAISVAAHLAVRSFSRTADGRRARAADAQLAAVRDAVWHLGADGEPCGFLADVGRPPRTADGTLCELWERPADCVAHTLVAATSSGLRCAAADRAELDDAGVFVPCGWRGPYLELPPFADRLRDPWGNPVETPDAAGLSRVLSSNGFLRAVAHFGPEAKAAGERSLEALPPGGANCCSLAVMPEFAAGFSGEISYRLYWPCGDCATGAVVRASYPAAALFEGLPPGVKILKDSATGVARRIVTRPGGNTFRLAGGETR